MVPGGVDKVVLLAVAVALLTPKRLPAGKKSFFSQGTHLRLIRAFDRIGLDLDLWSKFVIVSALTASPAVLLLSIISTLWSFN